MAQLIGTVTGVGIAVTGGLIVYGIISKTLGIRLSEEQEFNGADLSIHRIKANPEV
jgi:Amt family ammonium transporter